MLHHRIADSKLGGVRNTGDYSCPAIRSIDANLPRNNVDHLQFASDIIRKAVESTIAGVGEVCPFEASSDKQPATFVVAVDEFSIANGSLTTHQIYNEYGAKKIVVVGEKLEEVKVVNDEDYQKMDKWDKLNLRHTDVKCTVYNR